MTDNNIQGKVLSLFPNLSRRSPQGEDGTPSPFSKPFIGIYLFVTQIDKCPLSFEKILFNIFTVNQPILGTEPIKITVNRPPSAGKSTGGIFLPEQPLKRNK